MSNNVMEKLQKLFDEGKEFTYSNFCKMGKSGYPQSYKMEYISWKARVRILLENQFGPTGPVIETYNAGEGSKVLGNSVTNFKQSHGYLLASIKTAMDILKFEPPKKEHKKYAMTISRKIFVVHGHDESLKNQLENFLSNEIKFEPIVLHRKPDEGLTIIEKIEKHSDVGYAIIILAPEDISYSSTEDSKDDSKRNKELRARQNVIFEFGYFVGLLGRNRVCCLYKEGVELPTDVSGMLYKPIRENITEAAYEIIKELKAAGYQIKI